MTLRLSREWGNTEWIGGGKQCGYDLNTLYRIHIYNYKNIINVKILYAYMS